MTNDPMKTDLQSAYDLIELLRLMPAQTLAVTVLGVNSQRISAYVPIDAIDSLRDRLHAHGLKPVVIQDNMGQAPEDYARISLRRILPHDSNSMPT